MSKIRQTKWFGWCRDLPDFRDLMFSAAPDVVENLPPIQTNLAWMPEVFNQGALGSCVGNALAGVFKYTLQKQEVEDVFTPSRLFVYYNGRALGGTVGYDSGSTIRDGMKAIADCGVCPEKMWPYRTKDFASKPGKDCYSEALKHQAIEYRRVPQTLKDLKACLASGYVFAFGFAVYDSFDSEEVSKTGILQKPKVGEKVLGYHAVYCFGYNDLDKVFYVRNSWGDSWGVFGNFLMPYEFMLNPNLCADFWTLRLVEG